MPAEQSVLCVGDLVVTPCLPVNLLARAFANMEDEGTLGTVFFERVPTVQEFLNAFMEPGKYIVLGCFRQLQTRPAEFCGLGWAMNATDMNGFIKAECGMAFFRRQTRRTDNVQFGKMMLEMFFTTHNIDAIFGTTPEQNKLAVRYAQRLGMTLHGPVPDFATWDNKPTAAWLSHISKRDWLERTT